MESIIILIYMAFLNESNLFTKLRNTVISFVDIKNNLSVSKIYINKKEFLCSIETSNVTCLSPQFLDKRVLKLNPVKGEHDNKCKCPVSHGSNSKKFSEKKKFKEMESATFGKENTNLSFSS